jgi:hypothetical protein
MSALRRDQRMQLVEDYIAQAGKQTLGMGVGDQQRHLFRRCQQDIGRVGALPCPFRLRRVAGPGFDPNRQAHFLDRFRQVAFDVDGQCLERRDVQGVQRPGTGGARLGLAAGGELGQARQKTGQGLARPGRRDQQHRASGCGLCQQFELMRARLPAAAGEPAKERLGQRKARIVGGWFGFGFHGNQSSAAPRPVQDGS